MTGEKLLNVTGNISTEIPNHGRESAVKFDTDLIFHTRFIYLFIRLFILIP